MRAIILMSGLCVASSLAVAAQSTRNESTAVSPWETTALRAYAPASGGQTAGEAACPGSIWDHSGRLHVAAGIVSLSRDCLCAEQSDADQE
jgi:hypothetical protein